MAKLNYSVGMYREYSVKIALILSLLLTPAFARAQAPIPHVGVLVQEMGRAQSQALKGVTAELKQLGYSERKHFVFETRNARGDRSALQAGAAELVTKKVSVIFTTGSRATLASIAATREIPLVFVHPGDPVAIGLLKSPNDSTRNITGVAAYAAETTEKRLALFKQILPGLTKLHVFYDANNNLSRENLALVDSAAKKLAIQLVGHPVRSTDEFKSTFSNLSSETGAGVFQISDDLVESEAEFVFATARQKKLPTMFNEEAWAIAGATAAYGPSYFEMGRQGGRLIDQILKGKTPASLAIVRATKFDLTVNYRAAKFIGLELPNDLLKQANKVIR
jgi:putative ABC transport system substrate-binding protein